MSKLPENLEYLVQRFSDSVESIISDKYECIMNEPSVRDIKLFRETVYALREYISEREKTVNLLRERVSLLENIILEQDKTFGEIL